VIQIFKVTGDSHMTSFHECPNCKKDGISIPLQLEGDGQYCCSMCDSSYYLNREEIVIGKTN